MNKQYTPSEDIELLVKRLREMATLQDAIITQIYSMEDVDAVRVPTLPVTPYNRVADFLLQGGKE